MELGSNAKRQGKIKGSNKACDPNPLCFWVVFLVPLKITWCGKICEGRQAHFGATSMYLQIITNSEKVKPRALTFLTWEQTLKTSKQGEPLLFISLQKLMKAECWCYLKLFALFVRSGHCTTESWEQSCILPSQQILARSSRGEWSHSFPCFLFFSRRTGVAR